MLMFFSLCSELMRGDVYARLSVLPVTLPPRRFVRFIVVEDFQNPAYILKIFRAMRGQVQQYVLPAFWGGLMAYQRDIGKFRCLPVINLVRDKAARPECPEQVIKPLALSAIISQYITGHAVTVGFFDQFTGEHIAFLW